MEENDFDVFEGKTFKNVCRDIYERSAQKKDAIDLLISELRPMVKNVDDAIQIVPLIHKYLEVGVKNDEQLVKLAQVSQKLQTAKAEGGGALLLTDAEKEQLWTEVKDVTTEVKTPLPDVSASIIKPQ